MPSSRVSFVFGGAAREKMPFIEKMIFFRDSSRLLERNFSELPLASYLTVSESQMTT